MRRILQNLLTFIFISTLYACTPVYVPTLRNAPTLTNKGEVTGSASFGSAGANLQAAAAVTDHFALIADFQNADNRSLPDWGYRTHRAAEVGLGYYQRKRLYFDVFGGAGFGTGYARDSVFNIFDDKQKILSGRYSRLFLQSSIGMGGKLVEGAFTLRFSAVKYSDLDLILDGERTYISKHTRVFVEPAFTFRIYPGRHNFYFSWQAALCGNLSDTSEDDDDTLASERFSYSPVQLSVGVGFRLGRDFKPAKPHNEDDR